MASLRGPENKEKRKRVAHIIAGVMILFHAWGNYETGHGPFELFLVAGLVFLALAILHPVIERKAPWIDGVFFVIEACLSFLIAYEYFHAGKKGLPWCYVLTGLGQLALAIVFSRKGVMHARKHRTTE